MTKKLIKVLVVLLIAFDLMAQQAMIKGSVSDAKTSRTIDNVSIRMGESNKSVRTDKRGKFEISGLTYQKYVLTFSILGYQSFQKEVLVSAPVTTLEIALNESITELSAVTVRGESREEAEAKAIKDKVVPVTIITAKQMENRASNLNEILARQAGVQIRLSGGLGSSSRISVRGLEGKRVQIFIDGNPLNTPDGSLGINDLPLQIIDAQTAVGGDGLGSAVNVVLRHRDVSYIDATASYQSYDTKNVGLILKKTFDKQGIEIGGGVFDTRSDNNYTMASPYQPGLEIKRNHDYYHSLLAGGAIRFHKLWFDEVEIEGAYLKNDKQIQGIQKNIQHVESKGEAGVVALGFKKESFFRNKLGLRYK